MLNLIEILHDAKTLVAKLEAGMQVETSKLEKGAVADATELVEWGKAVVEKIEGSLPKHE